MELANESYWSDRYENRKLGWDIGYVSTPLKTYFDQLPDRSIKVLLPGAGNAYEADYLWRQGFRHTYVMDIAQQPLTNFSLRSPSFPTSQLLHEDFFAHEGAYDLIIEQTFFCSFPPTTANRSAYAEQVASLLTPGGKLVGLWFKHPLIPGDMEKRPFGGSKEEYLGYLAPYFDVKTFEDSYNSIPERMHHELFGIFVNR